MKVQFEGLRTIRQNWFQMKEKIYVFKVPLYFFLVLVISTFSTQIFLLPQLNIYRINTYSTRGATHLSVLHASNIFFKLKK